MYIPGSFAMPEDELHDLLRRIHVGDYVTTGPDGLQATYLPVVYDADAGEHGAFHLHFMRVNPQWRDAGEALLILHGNTHVIKGSYYADPDQVGTLNYETIHVWGTPVVHEDLDYLRMAVRRVAEQLETDWWLDDMNPETRDKMLRAAVGVELQITRIEAKAKLSQNKRPDVIARLADHLEDDGDLAAAELLRRRSLPGAHERQEIINQARARGPYFR